MNNPNQEMMAMLRPDEDLPHIFTKKGVSKYDLNRKLAFPVSLMPHLWPAGLPNRPDSRDFTVLDINLMPWHFVCKVRYNKRGNPKPEVSGPEWRRCIQEKQIRVGDKVAFYVPPPVPPPNHAAPPVFLISIKRKFRLGAKTSFEHVRV